MPIIKSAKKRVKTARKANVRNAKTKRNLRTAIKAFTKTLSSGKTEEIIKAERAAMSAIDTAAKKAVIHKNKAARTKAQIAAKSKAAGSAKKATAKKAATKRPTAKKPAAKKTTAKRAPKK